MVFFLSTKTLVIFSLVLFLCPNLVTKLEKLLKFMIPFTFVFKDSIAMKAESWKELCSSDLVTHSFVIPVHHEHRLHVCLRPPLLRSDLTGAPHAGQSTGQ